ncbi:MAG TPA: hypothetical protein VK083_00530 [Nocardia sp.]|uniref:hypothetical protein n=1 Tax=Nocardia TaxID=1817 RepID=UPI0024569D8F|nr:MULTISPECIES: hypothetical protein [Nocardia]HLS75259.1 hypothetical protein [Nocardia sp.]
MTPRTTGFAARVCSVLLLCLSVLVAGLPSASARPAPAYAAYLDLPSVNGEGEYGGALHPALPLDEPTLRAAVAAARADGVEPARYGTLLHQYWLTVALANAQIDPVAWDPSRGVAPNEHTFNQVYVNYLRLAAAHPGFYWAGLAAIAGGSFASGFFDAGDIGRVLDAPGVHAIGNAVADALAGTPAELVDGLPADIRTLVTQGARLSAADIAWYQQRLMIMQKHIFTDLVPMHEAYLAGGLAAVEELARAGVLDADLLDGWRALDSGTEQGRVDALIRMTDREQNHIVADQWDVTSSGRDGIGRVLTYISTLAAKPGVPGVRAPGVFAPATVRATVDRREIVLRTPLPDFNWADRDTRWAYITGDLVPRHIELMTNRPLAAAVLGETHWQKLANGRLVARLPELLADLGTQWQVLS